MEERPPFPPFTLESATQKVRLAEDAWNTREPARVARAYSVDIPKELDGTSGTYRAPARTCTLGENLTDYKAVLIWLNRFDSSATVRAYRKEAERLMLGSLFQKLIPLSSLDDSDAKEFRAFSPTSDSCCALDK